MDVAADLGCQPRAVREHGVDPKSGRKLAPSDLVSLNFFENSEGEKCDPVSFKVFNEHSHLVAVKVSRPTTCTSGVEMTTPPRRGAVRSVS